MVMPGWPMFLEAQANRIPMLDSRHVIGLEVKSLEASTTSGGMVELSTESNLGRRWSSIPFTVSLLHM